MRIARYEYIREAMAAVRTRKFYLPKHDFKKESISNFQALFGDLPVDYAEFLNEFGESSFFRSPKHNGRYLLLIHSPRVRKWNTGEFTATAAFCDFGNNGLYIQKDGHPLDGFYEFRGPGLMKVAESFEEWLRAKWDRCHREIGKRNWRKIIEGPDDFTEHEKQIAEAATMFEIEKLSSTPNGGMNVRVKNKSEMTLPWLTVRMVQPDGMAGNTALDVSAVSPGSEAVVHITWLKHVDSNSLQIEKVLPAGPEDRNYYYEFGNRPGPTKLL